MHTVRQLLGAKPRAEVFAVRADDSVFEAIRLMAEKGVGAVLVMDGARLAGIVSERDYARKVVLHDKASRTTPVRAIMTSELIMVGPEFSVDRCMQLVTEHRIRHLPVLDGDNVVGVVSIGDLVKAVIEQQQAELDHLQRYITAG